VLESRGEEGYVRRLLRDGYFVAKVTEAAGITRGQAVYISGASGANEEVELALSDDEATMPAAGIAVDDGDENDFIRVSFVGKIDRLDTTAFSTEGATLYVSDSTPGAMTETAPSSPSLTQRIGIVTRKHMTLGEILVNPPGQAISLSGGGGGVTLSDETPLVESDSGSAGTGTEASRDDHVHPADEGGGGSGALVVLKFNWIY
jgi:hypothetical protein